MVPNKKKSSRATRQPEASIPGGNTLSLVTFHGGERGFMAKNEDSDAVAFFDMDGEPIYSHPGWMVVIRQLGEYLPDDEDAFWSLIARA
jgi:hypothetical protein